MVWHGRFLFEFKKFVHLGGSPLAVARYCLRHFSASKAVSLEPCCSPENEFTHQRVSCFARKDGIDAVIDMVAGLNDESPVLQSSGSINLEVTDNVVMKLLCRFEDDWKSALGVFRWAESCSCYKPHPELYDKLVDILGKAKQMDKLKALVDEMSEYRIVSLNTIANVMRRLSGARDWRAAVKIFDELGNYGLKKDTEVMNLLLDSLSKGCRVEQAREVFLKLKSHIPANANTYNIFIHGWCKVNRVEEALWTMEEMKGNGFKPCVISYSTIIEFYCSRGNFDRAYELLEEMAAEGCPPNVVTFTTLLHYMTKHAKLQEALRVPEKMRSMHCKPDTLFYNALLHALGRAGQTDEALHILTKEMPENGVVWNTSSYNTMISMFCHHRQEQRALQFLSDLENSPYCKPDIQSFHPLLKSCFRDMKMEKRLSGLLDDMVKKHHLCLDLATFTLLIHGLCRAKKCAWAYQLFTEMVRRNLRPRYNTCSLLLQETRQAHMYDAVEMIEEYIKKMKSR